MAAWDENCTYHGVQKSTPEADDRIEVELSEYGPTERENVVVLRTLRPTGDWQSYGVGWGYNGGGTSAAASTILSDALGEEPSEQLREDFCADVLSQLTDEWRLRRGAVLRWVRGWYAENGVTELPHAVEQLPPISQWAYEDRPTEGRL